MAFPAEVHFIMQMVVHDGKRVSDSTSLTSHRASRLAEDVCF